MVWCPVPCATGAARWFISKVSCRFGVPARSAEGRGQIVRRPCTQCRGERQVRTERKLKVTIPAGVDTGTHLKLAHEGQSGFNGGPAGDLYVVVKVKEHPIFERQGDDLLLHCSHQRGASRAGNADQPV